MSQYVTWSIIGGLVVLIAYYVTRMARQTEEDGLHDTGLALLEFGRAFPQEAIRDLHATADRNCVFVRLHDSKAGLMRNRGNHFACHLIEPGRVMVTPMADAKGFKAEFLDAPTQSGAFVFASEAEAAEVSLWLLDNHVRDSLHETTETASVRPDLPTDRTE